MNFKKDSLEKDSLDYYINKEINKHNHILSSSIKHNVPFKYVSFISKKYSVSNDYLVDVMLDFYNDFFKLEDDFYKAKYLSLRSVHDFVLRRKAEKIIFMKF